MISPETLAELEAHRVFIAAHPRDKFLPCVDDAIFERARDRFFDPWEIDRVRWGLDGRLAVAWHHASRADGPPPITFVEEDGQRWAVGDVGPYLLARCDAAGWGVQRPGIGDPMPKDEDDLSAEVLGDGRTWSELRAMMRDGLPDEGVRVELMLRTSWLADPDGGDDGLDLAQIGLDLADLIAMLSPSKCAGSGRPPELRYLGAEWQPAPRFHTATLYTNHRRPHQRPRKPRRR